MATEEEKKAHPEVFQEVAPLAAKLRQMDESLATDPPSTQDRMKLEKQIHKLMRGASPKDRWGARSTAPAVSTSRTLVTCAPFAPAPT